MEKRTYNILFHTHTVSGIITAVALYVIFFAGSFSFFRDEIVAWERNEPVGELNLADIDLNRILDTVVSAEDSFGRDYTFHRYYDERRITVNISPSKTSAAEGQPKQRGNFFYLDTESLSQYSYASGYSLGELLYRLHFFAQLNFFGRSGYLLAGLVSFFFLFAIITGVLVHWNKIVSNFFVFRPGAKLKTLWTDMHTGLGLIGLPYQFLFALTGCFLIAGALFMGPGVSAIVYGGDDAKMYSDMGQQLPQPEFIGEPLNKEIDLNAMVDKAAAVYDNFVVSSVELHNYGDANMYLTVYGRPEYSNSMTQMSTLTYLASDGSLISTQPPAETGYIDAARNFMKRLHFGDFGGPGLRIIYFLLGILSSLVILSGIMIWLVARDKKNVSPAKRKFNFWLGVVFLSVCLTLLPTTAISFLWVKLFVSHSDPTRMHTLYEIFFYTWLILTTVFIILRNNAITNRYTLLITAIVGFVLPVANGLKTGNWLWNTWSAGYFRIFTIDLLWIILALAAAIAVYRTGKKAAALPTA